MDPLAHNSSQRIPLSKRAFDLILTTIGLVVFSPFLLVLAILVRVKLGAPVLFRQVRPGYLGKPFKIFKFRTMTEDRDSRGNLLSDTQRLTRFGRFLRASSLDELPELLNVLRGEMSWVGPRPAPPSEVAQYQPWHRQRLEVPQGLTGLWQVSGRSDLTFDEMCLLDIYYIENWSLGLDLTILFRTIPYVLFGRGAY
jgi:lipopolysaccharide/colanic/teichoic acid biosynthesis glycosyltransferase